MEQRHTSPPIGKNISAILELEKQFHKQRTWIEKAEDGIGAFVGSTSFVALQLAIFLLWILVNIGLIPGIPRFDPYPFILLSMAVSVEAVFLSTFVLMKQNRESKRADHRQHLTLQIDLLAEQESTKTLQLLRKMCDQLGIENAIEDPEIQTLSQNTPVDEIARDLDERLKD